MSVQLFSCSNLFFFIYGRYIRSALTHTKLNALLHNIYVVCNTVTYCCVCNYRSPANCVSSDRLYRYIIEYYANTTHLPVSITASLCCEKNYIFWKTSNSNHTDSSVVEHKLPLRCDFLILFHSYIRSVHSNNRTSRRLLVENG